MIISRRATLLAFTGLAACGPAATAPQTSFVVEIVAEGLNRPWSIAHLPNGDMLVTEKMGGIQLVRRGGDKLALRGAPENVLQGGDSGLLDIVLAPDFASSGQVFIAFVEGDEERNRLALYRARFEGNAFSGGEVIWRAATSKAGAGHPGGRIAFLPDGTLLLSAGEGYDFRDQAQELTSHLGKVLRLTRNGQPAPGNPFADRSDVAPEVYTYGHRNPYGLIVDPRDGAVWEHEMGPRGGDELNRLFPGANYGWPLATYGADYDGTMITPDQTREGVTDAVVVWNPSISPSGMALYLADAFPDWKGDFFVGALSGKHLRRVRLKDGYAQLQEVLLHERDTRIRDVRVGPDGYIYLATEAATPARSEIWRLRPGR